MKVVLALAVIILLLLVGMPMSMGEMSDCPMCTSPSTVVLGICGGVVSLLVLIVMVVSSALRRSKLGSRRFLLARSIYRPPRFV